MKLIDLTLKDYLKEVYGESPAPGGGSVSAYAGALGVALTQMVGSLTIDKKVFEELNDDEKAKMKDMQEKYHSIRVELEEIVDTDATSFDEVMAAFKLPKSTDEEKKARTDAIQSGYKKALEIPLRAAELCLEALDMQEIYANCGNKNAITDVGVGTLLLQSGLEGALFNVLINVNSIKDTEYADNIRARADELLKKGAAKKEETLKIVYSKLK
ncbi:MAG: cyclodeaminase/cyclohydrolase family protein [Firmicutes bacterium]|nr:cyclodeaminase/cyclohydrolase family protein [Bacillota bacterium]